MSNTLLAGLIGVVVFLLWVVMSYNRLVRLRYAAKNAWADTDVHLKKRYELVPNLVETVRAYADHESETFSRVAMLRSSAMRADNPAEKAKAENMLMATLRGLLAVAEAYPELKADANFQELMRDLKEFDDNIEFARRSFNSTVNTYNVATGVFPANIVAAAFAFQPLDFFELDDESVERKPVAIKFPKK